MDVASHAPTHASLIIVPNNLCKQWVNEVEKFVMPGALKVVRVFNKRDFDATHMKALQDADVVITTLHFLNGPVYRKYLAERDVSMMHRYYGAHGRSGTLSEIHPVFFQAFLWRRVIFDEQHELVVTRTLAHLLQGLKAEVYWGITATPSLQRNNFIFHLDPAHISLFPLYDVQLMRHAVRRTARPTEGKRPVIGVNHVVPLLDRERAMLEAYRNRGLEALIQLTTCFNVVALFGASAEEDEVVVTMTFEEVARVMVAKHDVELGNARLELTPLREQLQGLMQHLLQAGVEDAEGEGEPHTGLARLLQRQLKLCRRRVEKKEAELHGLEQQRQFFHSQLVQRQEESSNCPICFEDGANVVTECGHWFCKQCINSYFRTGTAPNRARCVSTIWTGGSTLRWRLEQWWRRRPVGARACWTWSSSTAASWPRWCASCARSRGGGEGDHVFSVDHADARGEAHPGGRRCASMWRVWQHEHGERGAAQVSGG